MTEEEMNEVQKHWTRAMEFHKTGRSDEAIVEWNNVLRLDPIHADALFNLGCALAARASQNGNRADREAACDTYRKVLSVKPDDTELWQRMATQEWLLGHKEVAMKAHQSVLTINPNNEHSLRQLAIMQMKSGYLREFWQTTKRVQALLTEKKRP